MEDTKKCSACGEVYPATLEFFHKESKGKYKVASRCKICKSLKKSSNRLSNKTKDDYLPTIVKYCKRCNCDTKHKRTSIGTYTSTDGNIHRSYNYRCKVHTKSKTSAKAHKQRQRNELRDGYIRKLLAESLDVKESVISTLPYEIIEVKRNQLILIRELNEQQH